MIAQTDTKSSPWLTSFLIYGCAALIGVNLVAVPASSVFLKELHGMSDQVYGAVFLPQLLTAVAGALLAGKVVLNWSLKSMLVLSIIMFALSLSSLALSSQFSADIALILIMLSTALFGFGFGFGGGPLNGIVCLQYPDTSSSALTVLHMMAGMGLVFGPFYYNAFEALGLWTLGPALASGVAVLFAIGLALRLETDIPQVSEEEGSRLPTREVYFWLMVGIALLYGFVEATFSNWASIFVTESRGMSAAVAATALSAFWGGVTFGRFVASFLLRVINPATLLGIAPFAIALSLVVIPFSDSVPEVIASFALAGLSCSAFFPLMISVSSEPYPHAVSWIVSMLTAALMTGVGLVSFLVGNVTQSIPMEKVYIYSLIYPLIILLLMFIAKKVRIGRGH